MITDILKFLKEIWVTFKYKQWFLRTSEPLHSKCYCLQTGHWKASFSSEYLPFFPLTYIFYLVFKIIFARILLIVFFLGYLRVSWCHNIPLSLNTNKDILLSNHHTTINGSGYCHLIHKFQSSHLLSWCLCRKKKISSDKQSTCNWHGS